MWWVVQPQTTQGVLDTLESASCATPHDQQVLSAFGLVNFRPNRLARIDHVQPHCLPWMTNPFGTTSIVPWTQSQEKRVYGVIGLVIKPLRVQIDYNISQLKLLSRILQKCMAYSWGSWMGIFHTMYTIMERWPNRVRLKGSATEMTPLRSCAATACDVAACGKLCRQWMFRYPQESVIATAF